MRLREALRIQRGDMVAFVGAGGKTSALFRLAEELHVEGWRVLATTTTRMSEDEMRRAPSSVRVTATTQPQEIKARLDDHGFVFLYSVDDAGRHKVIGLNPDYISSLADSIDSDVLLIEADGARRLPLKAPKDHEPVIPQDVSLVVPVAGLDILGQPFDEDHVYNASRILGRYGFPEGAPILPPWVAVTLRDPQLGLRGVPESARVVVLLNKVDSGAHTLRRARRIAQMILRSDRVGAVVLGSMGAAGDPVDELQQRVTAVVLAAGRSSRMKGQSKMLLPWGRQTVIEAVVTRLLPFHFAEIVVVTGYQSEAVERKLAQLPVRMVHNEHYEQGEMLSSLQTGLRALPDSTAACLVVLGDQPMLEGPVIGRVVSAYTQGQGGIVLPSYRGERGHPVLFARRFWPELLDLTSGAPRDVVRRYPDQVASVSVETDSILRDIDTPEQYRRERSLARLD